MLETESVALAVRGRFQQEVNYGAVMTSEMVNKGRNVKLVHQRNAEMVTRRVSVEFITHEKWGQPSEAIRQINIFGREPGIFHEVDHFRMAGQGIHQALFSMAGVATRHAGRHNQDALCLPVLGSFCIINSRRHFPVLRLMQKGSDHKYFFVSEDDLEVAASWLVVAVPKKEAK